MLFNGETFSIVFNGAKSIEKFFQTISPGPYPMAEKNKFGFNDETDFFSQI